MHRGARALEAARVKHLWGRSLPDSIFSPAVHTTGDCLDGTRVEWPTRKLCEGAGWRGANRAGLAGRATRPAAQFPGLISCDAACKTVPTANTVKHLPFRGTEPAFILI